MSDDDHLLIGRALGVTYRRENRTDAYVVIPPAFMITDSDGAVWTLGQQYNAHMEFNVLRNDIETGEFASRIEYNKGIVRLYSRSGWKLCSHSRKHIL